MDDQTFLSAGVWPAKLLVRQGADLGREFTLGEAPAILGREAGLDVSIQDAEMSRRHARVTWQQGEYVIEDMGSTNGTAVNGAPVREPQVLRSGDLIAVGQTTLEFVAPGVARPQPAPYAHAPAPVEPPTFQAPPAAPAPGAPVPAKKKSNCLLYGCGCIIILALLVAIAIVAALLLMPAQIQPIFDQMGVPVQLTDAATGTFLALV